jgi:MGT family glycosyltransferase
LSQIAVMSSPVFSHVHRGLGLIRELVARGHRVTYVNIPAFADKITATGAHLAGYTSTLPIANGLPPQAKGVLDALELSVNEDVSLLPQLRRILETDPPDLVFHENHTHAIRIVARNLGVPTLQFCTTIVPWEGQREFVLRQAAAVLDDLRGVELYRRFAAWLADNGMGDVDPADFLLGEPERALVLIPRFMQPMPEAVDANRYTFVGWCADEQEAAGVWNRPDGAAKLALISVGSVHTDRPTFYRECIGAFADLPDWHVVLPIGKRLDPDALGDVPANVEVHRWVPQMDVLEVCDLFVTHGGMGSCLEGLGSATPMIVVPHANDQFSNAERLVGLGVARQLDATQVTAPRLRATVTELMSDRQVAARLAPLSKELRAECGPARAADLVEQCLR